MIRTPELVKTPDKLLLFGQCRHANASSNAAKDPPHVGDNMLTVRMVTIESHDGGAHRQGHQCFAVLPRRPFILSAVGRPDPPLAALLTRLIACRHRLQAQAGAT